MPKIKPSTIVKALRNPIHALYTDELIEYLVPRRRKHAALISSPKSGSTWLGTVLEPLLGWHILHLLPYYGRREQEPEIHRLLLAPRNKNVFTPSEHCRYNGEILNLFKVARSQVIFQFRNIFDMVVSFRDHMNSEGVHWSMAYVDEDTWNSFDDERKLDLIVDMIVPWYFNFYCGWITSEFIKDPSRAIIVRYENLREDTVGEVQRVCEFLGEPKNAEDVSAAIELSSRKNTRKNKGVVGRGTTQLNDAQRERIIHYTRYYPTVDFTLLGITKEMIAEGKRRR